MAAHPLRIAMLPLAAPILLGACAQPAAAPAPVQQTVYMREAPQLAANDTNVYRFEHAGPNSVGTSAVTARPTAGPDAAPRGTLAGPLGRTRAEAAAAFYAQNELCGGGAFQLAAGESSEYDAAANSWTVFGRCAGA